MALFASGSSDPEAAENLAVAAAQLAQQAGCRGAPAVPHRPAMARRPAGRGGGGQLPAGARVLQRPAGEPGPDRAGAGPGRRTRSEPIRASCRVLWTATTRPPGRWGPISMPGRRPRSGRLPDACGPRSAGARPGSSVGTSDRLKSGRSAVRSCPWPPSVPGIPCSFRGDPSEVVEAVQRYSKHDLTGVALDRLRATRAAGSVLAPQMANVPAPPVSRTRTPTAKAFGPWAFDGMGEPRIVRSDLSRCCAPGFALGG